MLLFQIHDSTAQNNIYPFIEVILSILTELLFANEEHLMRAAVGACSEPPQAMQEHTALVILQGVPGLSAAPEVHLHQHRHAGDPVPRVRVVQLGAYPESPAAWIRMYRG